MPILKKKPQEPEYPNLLPEAKVYGTNKSKETDKQLNILTGKIAGKRVDFPNIESDQNPFTTQRNESIWNSWAENGRPYIKPLGKFGFLGDEGRPYYKPQFNVMRIDPGQTDDYFAELAHSKQKNEGMPVALRTLLASPKEAIIPGSRYNRPGSIEYEAHTEIEPKLRLQYPISGDEWYESEKLQQNFRDREKLIDEAWALRAWKDVAKGKPMIPKPRVLHEIIPGMRPIKGDVIRGYVEDSKGKDYTVSNRFVKQD